MPFILTDFDVWSKVPTFLDVTVTDCPIKDRDFHNPYPVRIFRATLPNPYAARVVETVRFIGRSLTNILNSKNMNINILNML